MRSPPPNSWQGVKAPRKSGKIRRGWRLAACGTSTPLRHPEIRPKQSSILCTSLFFLFNVYLRLFLFYYSVLLNNRSSFGDVKGSKRERCVNDSWDGRALDVIFPNIRMSHSLRRVDTSLEKRVAMQSACNPPRHEIKGLRTEAQEPRTTPFCLQHEPLPLFLVSKDNSIIYSPLVATTRFLQHSHGGNWRENSPDLPCRAISRRDVRPGIDFVSPFRANAFELAAMLAVRVRGRVSRQLLNNPIRYPYYIKLDIRGNHRDYI